MFKKKFSLLIPALCLMACSPDEGKGGLASVEGVVMMQNLNALSEKSGEAYPAADEDVFISYGNSQCADDKEATGQQGRYRFSNLVKGDYTLFVHSDDTVSNAKYPKLTFTQKISLDKKKTEAVADTFYIYKHVDYDDGGGVVKGSVIEHFYKGSVHQYELPAQDADVYLQFQSDSEILKRTRADGKGNFILRNLIPGKYKLYVYSENQLPADGDSVCYRTFEIIDNNLVVTLETINIKNW